MILLFSRSAAAPAAGIDVRNCFAGIYPVLHAQGAADMVWWTDAELFGYIDDAAKRLARETASFVERDTSITLVEGGDVYDLPARHVSTLHVAANNRIMNASTAQEIEALDSQYLDTQASSADPLPKRYLHDLDPLGKIRTYPRAGVGVTGQLQITMHRFPPTVSATAPILPLPRPLQEYFCYEAISRAHSKESKGSMPEVAGWYGELANMLLDVAKSYYGGAQ
jgi:hypothetical protein